MLNNVFYITDCKNIIDYNILNRHKNFVLSGWIIEFRLGASLLGHNVDIFTNHPLINGNQFERRTYYQLPWSHESAYLRVALAGSFHYYIAEST